MVQIQVTRFRSWDDFKREVVRELFGESPFSRGRFIFRGQRLADWKLESSFDRWVKDFRPKNRFRLAEMLVTHFKNECEGMEMPERLWREESMVLALGQHYGLPTRLLDWSESPYMAAFFAFSDALVGEPMRGDAAIWVLDTESPAWERPNSVDIIRVPSVGNMRLRNQSGLFTLLRSESACLDEYVEAWEGDGTPLRKFHIPLSDAVRAMADLDVMGINPARAYPELVGPVLAAKMRVALEVLRDRVV